MDDPHSVRWATSQGWAGYNYTKWHYTTDGNKTLCGRMIRLANDHGTFLPEHDDNKSRVTCKCCKSRIKEHYSNK